MYVEYAVADNLVIRFGTTLFMTILLVMDLRFRFNVANYERIGTLSECFSDNPPRHRGSYPCSRRLHFENLQLAILFQSP